MRGVGGEDDGSLKPPTVEASRLADLLTAALPAEELSAEELQATLVDDPDGAVLLHASGDGAVGVALRGDVGFVTVIVVDPPAQRGGVGVALLELAHEWLRARGAATVRTGASAPRYLWPGVDVDAHAAAVSLFGAAGYERVATTHNQRCSTRQRRAAPDGVEVRRVRAGSDDATTLVEFAAASFPDWVDEVERSLVTGCCHGAFSTSPPAALGFGCHSVNRAGWIGPMATDPAAQGQGIGAALLGAVCSDLELAGLDEAEIAWVGPDGFYERVAGATASRSFVILSRDLSLRGPSRPT